MELQSNFEVSEEMEDKKQTFEFLSSYPWLMYLFVIFFSAWGGIVNLIQRYRLAKERRFSLTEWIGEIAVSSFAGMLTYYICAYLNLHEYLMAAFIGISGHMGSRIIYVFEHILKERLWRYLGMTPPQDQKEDKENKL